MFYLLRAMRSSQSHFRPQCLVSAEPILKPRRSRSRLHFNYDNVRASIDSGLNMLKVNERFPESKVNARFKKEEFFRRMKPARLACLLNEAEVDCLILDVREHEAYLSCHLKDALSFPAPVLKRSMNVFSLEILKYINKEPEKIIVFYDENEVTASILAHKERKVRGKVARRYLVKFKNYSPMDAKWMEEAELVYSPQLLQLYLEAFQLQPTVT
ncbi:hypothetical protein L7F22_028740 [Adiantum nelumboides]|nr:hypothetical protein [Adiantum nelumboides]